METIKKLMLMPVVLNLFDAGTNVTTQTGEGQELSPEMKTYYSDYLIDMAEPNLVHDQFGQKHPIPKNGGKTIEFRKYSPLPKATNPITEGVTPNGQKLNVSTVTARVEQYGGFIELSDMLILTAIDNNLVEAMNHCEDLLVKYGGHELAAGLTVRREDIPAFRGGSHSRNGVPQRLSCNAQQLRLYEL